MSRSHVIFGTLTLTGIAVIGLYVYQAKTRLSEAPSDDLSLVVEAAPPQTEEPAASSPAPESAAPATDSGASPASQAPHAAQPAAPKASATAQSRTGEPPKRIYFRYTGLDSHHGKLAYVEPARSPQPHFVDHLSCEVVYVAGGRGICLTAKRGVFTTYAAVLFNADTFEVLGRLPLQGVPSRARVSDDGRLAALTVFVSGHGYTTLDFSTQTLLIDVAEAKVIADLETFTIYRDGQVISNPDFNFWGVTFTRDAKHFYATLSTNRQHFLIRGDVAQRTATVVHENVECPSLSPDDKRVAYKKRFVIDGRVVWELHVLDLQTGVETPLAERRSIDDQLEWLDAGHVLYAVPESPDDATPATDVWVAAADGTGIPRPFLRKAYSPSVVRR